MSKSSYEELRLKNIEDNKKILAELGILNPFKPLPRVVKTTSKRKRDPTYVPERKKPKIIVNDGTDPDVDADVLKELGSENIQGRRRSARVKGLAAPEIKDIEEDVENSFSEADEEEKARRKSLGERPMVFGAIPGVEVGRWWAMRIDCNRDGVHRPTVAGIHAGLEGAYSIALSGGYEDDIDMGDCFTYTGEGGRDLKGTAAKPKNLRTAPQSKDQCLSRGNAGLVKSCETARPVRVIRGFKLHSVFAPEEGYRYDGLYKVEKYWYTTGLAGFGVYKFAFRRLDNQPPPPWSIDDAVNNNTKEADKNKITSADPDPDIAPVDPDPESDSKSQDSGFDSQTASQETAGSESETDEDSGESPVEECGESANRESPKDSSCEEEVESPIKGESPRESPADDEGESKKESPSEEEKSDLLKDENPEETDAEKSESPTKIAECENTDDEVGKFCGEDEKAEGCDEIRENAEKSDFVGEVDKSDEQGSSE